MAKAEGEPKAKKASKNGWFWNWAILYVMEFGTGRRIGWKWLIGGVLGGIW
jgi:hypothetical protein